jgi:cytochrome oxidase Cu insertion factor (SCO1/SenC/PrrC family)
LIAIDDTHILLPDIEVLNQEGKRVRFYSDLVKDKIVILSFFYSSCVNVCISLGESLSKAQASLGARLGKEVFFISVSMDPRTDTPPKLKYWWRAFGARPGWTLVASDTPEMNKMLTGFTGNSPGPKDMHSAFVFIGNDRTGAWKTVNGLLDAPSLIQLIETVDDAAGEAK